MADAQPTSSDLNGLLRQSPFGVLLDIKGADGNNISVNDIFGNIGVPGGSNSFSGTVNLDANSPYGGNPFAGDNFWNTFAGGVNPSNPTTSNASGGFSPPGGTSTASAGGFSAPGGGTSTASTGGFSPSSAGSGTPVDPLAGDGSEFWNAFAGGVNPTTFSDSNIPTFAGGSPEVPTGASSTPVPEPSSVIGVAVIGLGIAATKFRQYQRRTVKVFNK